MGRQLPAPLLALIGISYAPGQHRVFSCSGAPAPAWEEMERADAYTPCLVLASARLTSALVGIYAFMRAPIADELGML